MTRPFPLAELELPIRPISQRELHPTAPDEENNACWYASALMVLGYRGPIATIGMSDPHTILRRLKNQGLFHYEYWHLANEVGLEHANSNAVLPHREAVDWSQALSTLGPLIVTIGAHIVVVRGIIRQGLDWHVVFNDPLPGVRRTMVMPRFNTLVNWSAQILFRRSAQRPPPAQMRPTQRPLDG